MRQLLFLLVAGFVSGSVILWGAPMAAADDAGLPPDFSAKEAPPDSNAGAAAGEDAFMKAFLARHEDFVIRKAVIGEHEIPAYVVEKKYNAADIKPAVVLVHGHSSNKEFLFHYRWPEELAYMGFVVVAIDAWGHGERDVATREQMEAKSWIDGVTKAIFETAKELPQVYDYLAARPDIDASRIGVMGPSMGGAVTIAAAAMDNKFAAFVPVSAGCNFLAFAERGKGQDYGVSEELEARIKAYDPVYYPERIAQRPVCFVHGMNDVLVPPTNVRKLYEKLKPLYNEHPDRLGWQEFDVLPLPAGRRAAPREIVTTHYIAPGMTQAGYDWFAKFLLDDPLQHVRE
jgi:dienelactone hydrolase